MAFFPSNNRIKQYQGRQPRIIEEAYKVNERITSPFVRIVGDNVKVDVYPISEAVKLAQDQELDLVEISPNSDPPVCKIINYSKFKYEQKKKQKEIKSNAQRTVIKEIRLGPNTDDHDFNFKVKHAINFLKEGSKVKSYVHFAGRSIVYKERGEILLLKFAQGLEDVGKVEQFPKLEGKRMYMIVVPKVGKMGKKSLKK